MKFESMTIKAIKEWLEGTERTEVISSLSHLEKDHRQGVKQLLKQWYYKEQKQRKIIELWEIMNKEEQRLRKKGITYIAGVDEVGRGPLAGPVVTAAVILPADFYVLGINDSKQLSPAQREGFAEIIKKEAIAYSISSIDAPEIDRLNIYQATLKAMQQALAELSVQPQFVLIDAMKLALSIPQKSIIKGDANSVSIAAASILAKVFRDTYMCNMDPLYPQYGFERNMGYGTKEHIEALQKYGPTALHRRSFISKFSIEKRAKQND